MMKEQEWILITFESTVQAIVMEKTAKKYGLSGRLIPVPGEVKAGCGMAWRSEASKEEEVLSFMEAYQLEMEAKYRIVM